MEARKNPYRSSRVDNIPFIGPGVDELALKFKNMGFRGSLVGLRGTGKTTLMLELCELFSGHYAKIENYSDLFNLPKDKVLFVDGTEKIRFASVYIYLFRKQFLLSLHKTNFVPVLYRTESTLELFKKILEELEVKVDEKTQAKVFSDCKGNIRDCLRLLYDEVSFGQKLGNLLG